MSADYDIREDEEQEVKFQEICELLVGAGITFFAPNQAVHVAFLPWSLNLNIVCSQVTLEPG